MEYIVLDMEWNQALNFSEMVKDPVFLTGEIIQIGAIKLNQTLEVVDSFNERIAPQYYTELHPKVAENKVVVKRLIYALTDELRTDYQQCMEQAAAWSKYVIPAYSF